MKMWKAVSSSFVIIVPNLLDKTALMQKGVVFSSWNYMLVCFFCFSVIKWRWDHALFTLTHLLRSSLTLKYKSFEIVCTVSKQQPLAINCFIRVHNEHPSRLDPVEFISPGLQPFLQRPDGVWC